MSHSFVQRSIRASLAFSTKGARPAQEDHLLVSQERKIFVVADGFGGPVAGATASKTACEAVRGFLEKEAGDLDATMPFVIRSYFSLAGNVLFNALVHANRKVTTLNRQKNVHEKGGASVIAGFMDGDLLALANVGLCSAWLFRGSRCVELVTPRSYARLQDPFGDSEGIAGLQAPLMAVGMAEDLEPEITEYRIRAGDWLLMQSDGVDGGMRAACLELFQRGLKPSEAVSELDQLLKSFQPEDNAAALLLVF